MKDKETAAEKTGAEKKKRKGIRILLAALLVIFGTVFAVSLYMLIDYYRNADEEQDIIDDL
ncbi:MAG: hypothetical protein IKR59_06240, partial [Lachnospiraceae bacterium]|nr:hypothetical protein [Lachnospiraceae bacterium]